MGKLRGFHRRDKLRPEDMQELNTAASPAAITAPGAAGYTPSPHSLSSAHHTGTLGNSQAPQFAYAEGYGTDRPAYNANRMTAAVAHVLPALTDTYDLGDATHWWRQAFVSQINGAVYAEETIHLLGGWFIVGHAQGTLQMPTAYLQVETATVLGSITAGVAQVETATVTGGPASAAGTMTVTVTANGMTGSPAAFNVPFASGCTASELAASIRSYTSFVTGIADFFTIGGTAGDFALTAKTAIANDGTMNIALSGASAQGFPDDATSTNTTAGVVGGAGTVSVIVTAAGMTGSPITVTTGLDATSGWTATQVATMIAANLPGLDANIDGFFTITSSGAGLIFARKAYAATNDATMNVAIDNGTCTGLTAAPTSANTMAGGDRTDIDFGVTLAVNDFIKLQGYDIDGNIKTEYMQVVAAVSGTTYTVTRDVGSLNPTDPIWAEGTPWLNLGQGGTAQVETATIVGTITGDGLVKVTVTAANMYWSPKIVYVAVLNGDSAATVAGKIRTALAADQSVGTFFTVSGSSADVVLTVNTISGNDATMNIAYENSTCTGLTDDATSTNTTAGVAPNGRIELNAYDTPRISVFTQGDAYNAQTEMVRMGDLASNWGYVQSIYGIGMGAYASGEANITLETANGLRLRSYATTKIWLQPNGDIFIGSDVGYAASTYLSIFSNAQTYNSESVGAGDLLIGDNSPSKANILWDYSAGKLQFRGGTTMQCEIGTDGAFLAGAGKLSIDATGTHMALQTSLDLTTAIRWDASGTDWAKFTTFSTSGINTLTHLDVIGHDTAGDGIFSVFLRTYADRGAAWDAPTHSFTITSAGELTWSGNANITGDLDQDGTYLGLLGAVPVVQQSHIINADGTLADITTKFNTLLADLENYGLLATS